MIKTRSSTSDITHIVLTELTKIAGAGWIPTISLDFVSSDTGHFMAELLPLNYRIPMSKLNTLTSRKNTVWFYSSIFYFVYFGLLVSNWKGLACLSGRRVLLANTVRENPPINNHMDEHRRSFIANALIEIMLLRKATHQTIEKIRGFGASCQLEILNSDNISSLLRRAFFELIVYEIHFCQWSCLHICAMSSSRRVRFRACRPHCLFSEDAKPRLSCSRYLCGFQSLGHLVLALRVAGSRETYVSLWSLPQCSSGPKPPPD